MTPFLNGADLLPDYEQATLGAELIIVDNGSDEPTATALQSLPPERGRVLRNETNAGFAGANNQGYAVATGDVIVFLNSDIAGDAAWLQAVAEDVKGGALYGPSLAQQLVGGRWLPYLEGWCIAATRATWEQIRIDPQRDVDAATRGYGVFPSVGWRGPWDALAYSGPYWEDNDLCFRALQAGIALIQTTWAIQHKGGRTAGALAKHAHSLEANRATFAQRVLATEAPAAATPAWHAYQQHVHTASDIQHHLPLLYSLARGNVLELGTRGGVSTAALLAGVEMHGGKVVSVDIDPACANVAAGHPLWAFWHGSSMDASMAQDIVTYNGAFDLILIDTEHTMEQAQAELALWGPHVKPGGHICMHDPETFPGVRRAAYEFAAAQGWGITIVIPCNGMAVLVRPGYTNDGSVSTEGAAWAAEGGKK